jgi:hypothetical protein
MFIRIFAMTDCFGSNLNSTETKEIVTNCKQKSSPVDVLKDLLSRVPNSPVIVVVMLRKNALPGETLDMDTAVALRSSFYPEGTITGIF